MRLYNPKNGSQFDTESDDEAHNQVYLDAGWVQAPDPEPAEPGFAPVPVTYAPVEPKKAPAAKKAAAKGDPPD
jgi:hypothetical protein